jgi:hypothetical protein
MNWYAKTQSSGQGIIADEETGRTVAIAFDGKDAALLAAAPEMRELLALAADTIADMRDRYDPKTPIESDIEQVLATLN